MQTKVHKMLTPTQPIPTSQYKWKEPSNKVHVVAGNVNEFNNYRHKKMLDGSTDAFYYVTNVNYLRGLSEIKGVFIGTWRSRSDIQEIQHQINIIKQKMAEQEQQMMTQKAATLAAQTFATEIDKEILSKQVSISNSGNVGIGTNTNTSSSMSFNTGSSIQSLINSQTSILTEAAIRDMMKQYIDEALKNPSTLGGI